MREYLLAVWPSVVNHLWQSTVFAVGIALLTLLLRRNPARVRYSLWLAASMKFLLPFSLLVSAGGYLARPRPVVNEQPRLFAVADEMAAFAAPVKSAPVRISETSKHTMHEKAAAGVIPDAYALPPSPSIARTTLLTEPPTSLSLRERVQIWLPEVLAFAWLCGMVTVLAVWAMRWHRVRLASRNAVRLDDGREMEAMRRVEESAIARSPVPLLLSSETMEPGVFGVFRPVLLWPKGLSDRLDDEHIEAIVAHELMHAQRRDNLTATLHMAVEALLWFHPLVWWMERRLVEERERACDEAVVERGGQAAAYAESLLRACRFCVESPLACVAGITGADLASRIRSIMTLRLQRLSPAKKLVLAVLILLVVGVPVVLGQMRTSLRMGQELAPRQAVALAVTRAMSLAAPMSKPSEGSTHVDAVVTQNMSGDAASSSEPQAQIGAVSSSDGIKAGLTVLSDTKGVDFSSYMKDLHDAISYSWMSKLPSTLSSSISGVTGIQFKVLPDGQISSIAIISRSGNSELDKAAFTAIADHGTLPLPTQYHGADLALQVGFYVNMQSPGNVSVELKNDYQKWAEADVRWIITDQELAAFKQLKSDEERDAFRQAFWQRRGAGAQAEHERRTAYANNRFSTAVLPGWKSDRGMIYIRFGKPDDIETHQEGGAFIAPEGRRAVVYPFEVWRYRHIAGVGDKVDIEFVDTCKCGDYRMELDRSVKGAAAAAVDFQRLDEFVKLQAPPLAQKNDSSVLTNQNETGQRITYANENFGFPGTPGEKSQRGRVYIRLGKPDSVERNEASEHTPAYEFWRYRFINGIDQPLYLEFVDSCRCGNYQITGVIPSALMEQLGITVTVPVVRTIDWAQLQELHVGQSLTRQSDALRALNGKVISIDGFAREVPGGSAAQTTEFLLIPYTTSGMPPLPPNQRIYVKMQSGENIGIDNPMRITGRLRITTVNSPWGPVFYEIDATSAKAYLQPTEPRGQGHLPVPTCDPIRTDCVLGQ